MGFRTEFAASKHDVDGASGTGISQVDLATLGPPRYAAAPRRLHVLVHHVFVAQQYTKALGTTRQRACDLAQYHLELDLLLSRGVMRGLLVFLISPSTFRDGWFVEVRAEVAKGAQERDVW